MSMTNVDVYVIPNLELNITTKIVRLLDERLIHGAWIADSPPTHWRDVYATLVLCASQTSRIGLGPGVTNPVTRHPSVTAAAIATGRSAEDVDFGFVINFLEEKGMGRVVFQPGGDGAKRL